MGTWPIYKNTSYNWSKQKTLSFDNISSRLLFFFLSFRSVLVSHVSGRDREQIRPSGGLRNFRTYALYLAYKKQP